MSDEVEYPGVYVDESTPGHPIEGVKTSWAKAVCAGVIALGAFGAVRALRRRRWVHGFR